MKFRTEHVRYMPKHLEPGTLYVSNEFNIAIHLCACGCGTKIKTPIGPTEWSIRDTPSGPTLSPSVGNWQERCQSHYLIQNGNIVWARKWSEEEILEGRQQEEVRRQAHYAGNDRTRVGVLQRIWSWVRNALWRR